MTADFSWRKPDDKALSAPRYAAKNLRKRRALDDESPTRAKPLRRVKRRTPRITGQRLPVTRLVELLDRETLQNLLHQVVQHHPEVAPTVQKLAPEPLLTALAELLRRKAREVAANLPYKCDVESDYLYTRVKGHLEEFLHCVSDFVLSVLPPTDAGLANACAMLDVVTGLVHELPNFSNSEFQYTKAVAYEQLANLWLVALDRGDDADRADEWVRLVRELDLVAVVEKHDRLLGGKLAAVVEMLKGELAAHAPAPLLSDLITVDYSNFSLAAKSSH